MAVKRDPGGGKAKKVDLANELERQKAFLELLVETIPSPVFYKDTEGRYTGCNRAFEEYTGLSRADIIGKSVFDMGPREIAEKYAEKDEELYGKPGKQSYEWKMKDRSGQVREVLFHKASIQGPDGKIAGLIGVITDISDLKEIQEKLSSSREMFDLFLNSTTEMVFLKNAELRHEIVNDAYLKFLGKTRDEVIGRTDLEILPRDLAEQCLKGDKEVLRSNRPMVANEFGEGRVFESRKFPVPFSNGTIGLGGFIRDVTDRKQAEDALKDQSLRLESAIKGADAGIWEWNVQTGEMVVNDIWARIMGYTLDELYPVSVGTWEAMTHPEDLERLHERLDLHFEGKLPYYDSEIRKKHKDGSWVWLQDRGSIITRTGDGKPLMMFGACTDITERKIAEEKLRRSVQTTIDVLIQAVERRDPYTAGHQRRVAGLAAAIASGMGLVPENAEGIRMAGYVHDIGKISVPSEILSKPGRLSEIEMDIIREHPLHGQEILRDIESVIPLGEVVYQHHERLDGSGYPQGLKGKDILLEALILAVADVVEAISSNRPYRAARGIDVALEEIENNKGTLYCPDAVDVCLRLFREKGYAFEE